MFNKIITNNIPELKHKYKKNKKTIIEIIDIFPDLRNNLIIQSINDIIIKQGHKNIHANKSVVHAKVGPQKRIEKIQTINQIIQIILKYKLTLSFLFSFIGALFEVWIFCSFCNSVIVILF